MGRVLHAKWGKNTLIEGPKSTEGGDGKGDSGKGQEDFARWTCEKPAWHVRTGGRYVGDSYSMTYSPPSRMVKFPVRVKSNRVAWVMGSP